jgi:hypothetical protein
MDFWPVPIDEVVQGALASGEVLRASGMVAVEGLQQTSEGFIAGNFEPGVNLQAWLDRQLVPGRIYEKTWDPEGLLSTLPAIGSGITGMMAGHLVLNPSKKEVKVNHLFLLGFCMLLGGQCLGLVLSLQQKPLVQFFCPLHPLASVPSPWRLFTGSSMSKNGASETPFSSWAGSLVPMPSRLTSCTACLPASIPRLRNGSCI